MTSRQRVLSGVRPTGQLHLGNYCGAIRQFLDLQDEGHDLYIFVASYHALTTHHDAVKLRQSIRQVVIDYLAFGLDPARSKIYLQHDVPEVTELAWLLACVCPLHLADKGVTYKDFQAKGESANLGIYNYPILQAADILAVDADLVPVGRDQVQNVEICRDLAGSYNHLYGAGTLKQPAFRLVADAEVLPGTDGRKMSKSYDNIIDPFQDEKALRKTIMRMKTDSADVAAVKDPETCAVYRIFRALAGATDARTVDLAARYRAGGMGYGEAKQSLYELILEHFAAARQRRAVYAADPGLVDQVLRQGATAARAAAVAVLARARRACGLA